MAPANALPPLDTYQAVVSAYGEFLTVAIHTILYERDIYPRTSFLKARKYNYPVRQNRHPKVCKWIADAVAAVEAELLKCTIATTSLLIYSPASIPLERYIFSTASFPRIPQTETLTPFTTPIPTDDPPTTEPTDPADPTDPANPPNSPAKSPPTTTDPTLNPVNPVNPARATPPLLSNPPSQIDLHVQFPPLLARLSTLNSTLSPLPKNCTYTIAIELRPRSEGGEAPIGVGVTREGPAAGAGIWMAAEPGLQAAEGGGVGEGKGIGGDVSVEGEVKGGGGSGGLKGEGGSVGGGEVGRDGQGRESLRGKYLGGLRTTPVRTVEAGPFVMEVWVEEGAGKAAAFEAEKGVAAEKGAAALAEERG